MTRKLLDSFFKNIRGYEVSIAVFHPVGWGSIPRMGNYFFFFFLYDLCALNFWDKCFTIWIAKATKIIFILTYVYDYFISIKLKQIPDVSANVFFHIWSMKSFSYFQILIFCGLIHFELDVFWCEKKTKIEKWKILGLWGVWTRSYRIEGCYAYPTTTETQVI